jgi:hypothetical protein
VSLGWELIKFETGGLGHQPRKHEIIPLFAGVAYDDVYTFNPQQSSQWDGLPHFSQSAGKGDSERMFYGGTTAAESRIETPRV